MITLAKLAEIYWTITNMLLTVQLILQQWSSSQSMHAWKQKEASAVKKLHRPQKAIAYLSICCLSCFRFCRHCSRSGWEEEKESGGKKGKKERKNGRERERLAGFFAYKSWKAGGLYTDLSSVRYVFYCWAAVRKAVTDWQCSLTVSRHSLSLAQILIKLEGLSLKWQISEHGRSALGAKMPTGAWGTW